MMHYYAIRWMETPANSSYPPKLQMALVSRDPHRPENMYLLGGPTHSAWPEHYDILRDYGEIADDDFDRDIINEYLRDFPPEPFDLSNSSQTLFQGFISPAGIPYMCEREGHSSLARSICIAFLNYESEERFRGNEDELDRRGWLAVAQMGQVSGEEFLPIQVEFLQRLITAKIDKGSDLHRRYASNVAHSLKMREPQDYTILVPPSVRFHPTTPSASPSDEGGDV